MLNADLKIKFFEKEIDLSVRTYIMGIINVTPDSFSDGGFFFDQEAAIAHGERLWQEGADILDVGGESSRPGSDPISTEEEIWRVLPVINVLAKTTQAIISIDTSKAHVAEAAIKAGVSIINDITALRGDPAMAGLIAESKAAVVLMHMKGNTRDMQINPNYENVLFEVKNFLRERIKFAIKAGIHTNSIIIDPGIGFGKTLSHNLILIRYLGEIVKLGYPVLLGTSRKSFIGALTGRLPLERIWGSLGSNILGAVFGASILRVHDIAALKEALIIFDAVMQAGV